MFKKITISYLLQLITIPILYWVIYYVVLLFHTPYNYYVSGVDFYRLTLIIVSVFVTITLFVLNIVFAYWIKNRVISLIIHLAWFLFIVYFTLGDLYYRPYTYGLVLFCIASTMVTRIFYNRLLS